MTDVDVKKERRREKAVDPMSTYERIGRARKEIPNLFSGYRISARFRLLAQTTCLWTLL